jgi:chitinase
MKTMVRLISVAACCLALTLLGGFASTASAASCSGVPTFASCTAYANGAQAVFNNTLYHTIAPIPNNRDCPPNSPYDPSNDNWWVNDGACSGATATATATKAPTATATKGATATATKTSTATATKGTTATPTSTSTATATKAATATATKAPTATATKTSTATATQGAGGCSGVPAFASCTAYASGTKVSFNGTLYTAAAPIPGTRDCPPNSPFDPSSDNWWTNNGACSGGTATPTATQGGTATPTATATMAGTATATATGPGGGGRHHAGYFAQWGIYARGCTIPNGCVPSGIERLLYAFNNPNGGGGKAQFGVNQAGVGDQWADYGQPQNGEVYNAPLKGNFHSIQLKYGGHGASLSVGGWTWSDGFYPGAANPPVMVASYIDAVVKGNIPNVAGQGGPGTLANVFDGIDLDWEYPGICGNNPSCAASSADKHNFTLLVQEFRKEMDAAKPGMVLSAAVAAGVEKITNYEIAPFCAALDEVHIMTYDFFGAWAPTGPTAPHSPLFQFAGQSSYPSPTNQYYTEAAVNAWVAGGCPRGKIQIGDGAYGRGWNGTFTGTGLNQPATGASAGTYDPGVDDYKVLVTKCPSNNTGAGTAWCNGSSQWWSYDTPATVAAKANWAQQQGLRGMFMWAFDGDQGGAIYNARK